MAILNSKFLIRTKGNSDIVDLTYRIKKVVKENKLENALVCVHSPFSSVSIRVGEYDPGLVKDFSGLINKIVPMNKKYKHNVEWEDDFAHMYIKTLLIGNSAVIPFINGEFELDRFQKILLFDFDTTPKTRSVIIQMIY